MILKLLEGGKTAYTPVWFMRQAGRYMKEYRDLKEKHSFLEMCKTPELAAEVTLQPLKKINFDAAIMFSDILIPAEKMGQKLVYAPGPVLSPPVNNMEEVERLKVPSRDEYGFTKELIKKVLAGLPPGKDLIGFAGAPLTMLAYMMEGKSKTDFSTVKKAAGTEFFSAAIKKVSSAIIEYSAAQAEAGIKVFQLFDTWAGILEPAQFQKHVMPYLQETITGIKASGMKIIYFFKDGARMADTVKNLTGVDAFSVDSSDTLDSFDKKFGKKFILQGNLAPKILLADRETIKKEIDKVLKSAAGLKGHIFNLGHGVLPATPEDNVKFTVDYIHGVKK